MITQCPFGHCVNEMETSQNRTEQSRTEQNRREAIGREENDKN
jgi:hypothetical protein